MKKILPYILILMIFVNLFAPLSVGVSNDHELVLQKNVANAGSITLVTTPRNNDTSITVDVQVTWANEEFGSSLREGVQVTLTGGGIVPIVKEIDLKDDGKGTHTQKGSIVFGGLPPDTDFKIETIARQISTVSFTLPNGLSWNVNGLWSKENNNPETINKAIEQGSLDQSVQYTNAHTLPLGQKDNVVQASQRSSTAEAIMPDCSTGGLSFSIKGCIGQGLYYLLFIPTSYLFALTGVFFDFTFNYSVQDKSYRSTFVVEGWGIVRDFCNMFFIFVLLYIAFATILNLHGFKTKEMIVNVIIIGVMINFSLFAAQLVIDASNIMARVFYNSDTIAITQGTNAANCVTTGAAGCLNKPTAKVGPNGEIPLSAALVNKINPQNLIINAKNVGNIPDNGGQTNSDATKNGISAGTFILVTLLATAVNVVGMIVFLSVGLIFVARVIGLWFSMIFAPLAFFSYTVPQMQGLDMVGWKKWWPELLSLSFLAPVFIFFLYLIIKFLNTGLDLINVSSTDGLGFVMSIVVPFAFIMVLLMKAKDIAKDMSGKLGQSITGGIAAAGGLALGGAALGTAFLGRQTLGAVSKYTQNDGARKNALSFKDTREAAGKIKGWNTLNPFAYVKLATKAVSGVGKFATAGVAAGAAQIGKSKPDPVTGKVTNWFQREGKKAGDKTHSVHVLDEKAQVVTGNKESKYKDLTEDEQKTVRDRIDRDLVSKEQYNKVYDKLTSAERAGVDGLKVIGDPNGEWAQAADLAKQQAHHTRGEHVHTATDLQTAVKADTAISEFVTALRKGSYDVRNLSQVKSVSGGIAKMGVGLIAGVAAGVRTGLKQTGVNHGSGQADFFADIGHTISEAMKSAKVDVKVEQSHGKSADDGSHGGGGH